jgi:hypothetical protein
MNPAIKSLLTEASELAKKIRGKLTEIQAVQASITSIQRSQETEAQELAKLIEAGDFENEVHVKAVAEKDARLKLFPAKLKQFEADLATRDEAFTTYLRAVDNLLIRMSSECVQAVQKQIANILTNWISEEHRRVAVAQDAAKFADLCVKTHNVGYGQFSQIAIQEAKREGRPLSDLAPAALAELAALPEKIEANTIGKSIVNAS